MIGEDDDWSSVVCRTVRMTFVASLRIRSVAESNVAGRSAQRTIGNDRASSSACAFRAATTRDLYIRFEIIVTMTGSDVRRVVRSGRPGVPVRDRIRSAICEYIMKGKALHGSNEKGKHGTCAVNQVNVVILGMS